MLFMVIYYDINTSRFNEIILFCWRSYISINRLNKYNQFNYFVDIHLMHLIYSRVYEVSFLLRFAAPTTNKRIQIECIHQTNIFTSSILDNLYFISMATSKKYWKKLFFRFEIYIKVIELFSLDLLFFPRIIFKNITFHKVPNR